MRHETLPDSEPTRPVSERHAKHLASRGYVVIDDAPAPGNSLAAQLAAMANVGEVRAFADAQGVNLAGATRRADIEAAVVAALEPAPDPDGGDADDGTTQET